MSVHVMSWVLRHSEERLGNRLVLLVLADHANEEGSNAYPSQATIAREARLSRSQAQRCLASLTEHGAVVEEGLGPKGTKRYRVVMGLPQFAAPPASSTTPEGAASTSSGSRRMRHEPSLEPSKRETSLQSSTTANAVVSRAPGTSYDPLKGMKVDGKNLPWDALVDVTRADENLEAGQIGRALKLIREAVIRQWPASDALSPEMTESFIATEIVVRASQYRARWPNVELTPTALAKNWTRVMTPLPGRDPDSALAAAQAGIEAARRQT